MLAEVREKLGTLDAQLTITAESLGQLRGSVGDLQSVATPAEIADNANGDRETLREAWEKIRDNLERIAADPAIDGRTRARYSRLDRRRYGDLLEALARDRRLNGHADKYREAVELWLRFRNGRRAVTGDACRKMNAVWDAVRPAE